MPSGVPPTASEVLDLIVRLERDPKRRMELATGWSLFQAAASEGLVGADAIDWIAQAVQELMTEELIAAGMTTRGPQPPPAVWDGYWLQQHFNLRTTSKGRADAALHRQGDGARPTLPPHVSGDARQARPTDGPDVFISHASEDKAAIARPLAEALRSAGLRVWYDEFSLRLGDSLRRSIDTGLAAARYGVVILSPSFFAKEWPQRELDGLVARETVQMGSVILPVWHEVDAIDVARFSPTLADRYAVRSSDGLTGVVTAVKEALAGSAGGRATSTSSASGLPQLSFSGMPERVELDLMMSGRQLVPLILEALEFVLDMDSLGDPGEREHAARFLQYVKDLGDILGDLDLPSRVQEEERLTGELLELLETGLVVYAGPYERVLIAGKKRERWPGLVVRVVVAPSSVPQGQ